MRHYPDYRAGRLAPQAEALLDELARSSSPRASALTPAEARASFLPPSWHAAPGPVAAVRVLRIPGPGGELDLRVYVPQGQAPVPVLAFFHGGGFVVGALQEFDAFCSRLAAGTPCLVASVGYRLAPEHPYPAAPDDAVAALRWLAAHAHEIGGDPARLAVAGDSAGGNLAAVAVLAARDQGFPRLALQVLLSPWLDLSSDESDSFRLFGRGPWLSLDGIGWYRGHYLRQAAQARDPRVSPLLAPDLGGLPPTLIVEAEFDVLRDQGRAYAERLGAAGNVVQQRRYAGTLHDFAVLPGLFDQAEQAIGDICAALRKSFAGAPEAAFSDAHRPSSPEFCATMARGAAGRPTS